jgi:hypothetical protein
MLTREEAASRLGICESTLIRWVEHGLVARHAYNAHAYFYETAWVKPTGQTFQSMGPAHRSRHGTPNGDGVKVLPSNGRRCSMKIGGW